MNKMVFMGMLTALLFIISGCGHSNNVSEQSIYEDNLVIFEDDSSIISNDNSNIDIINNNPISVIITDKYGKVLKSNFNTGKILSVPYLNQDDFPTGCESVSTVMALNYLGIEITVDEFIDYYLDKDYLEEIDGIYYGQNPDNYFIGNPKNIYGLGCYAPCIVKACKKFVGDKFIVENLKNTDFSKFTNYIDNNIPVIVWITTSLKEPFVSSSWILKDSGETFTYLGNEHCVLLIGYDDIYYYFNDPIDGITAYRKDIVEQRYIQMGSNAVVIKPIQ